MNPLKFKCPKCGNSTIEEVLKNVVVTSEILAIDAEQGRFLYWEKDNSEGDIVCFQCSKCGKEIKDEDGDAVTSVEGLIDWLRERGMLGE